MSVTYTTEEQRILNSLAANEKFFKTTHELLQKGSFPGVNAPLLLECFASLETLIRQNAQQQAQIQQQAQQRAESESKGETEATTAEVKTEAVKKVKAAKSS